MKTIIAASMAAVLMFGSSDSKAWGPTEQGILWGVLGTVTLGHVFDKSKNSQYYPENPNGDFPPFRCSGNSVDCAYQRGKWERERIEWQAAKDRAYQCGRYPEKCGTST
jgi:hypothetical protein